MRRLRFRSYCQRMAALDSLCRQLCNGQGMHAVVVLGACECSSGFGYFPAPLKELRRRLELHTRVVVIDEHYTSQRCSDCAFAEEPSHHRLDAGRCGDTQESGASGEDDGRERSDTRASGETERPIAEPPLSPEEQQAMAQWLRRVPDDPGGLLRRKFKLEYSRRHKGERAQGTDAW